MEAEGTSHFQSPCLTWKFPWKTEKRGEEKESARALAGRWGRVNEQTTTAKKRRKKEVPPKPEDLPFFWSLFCSVGWNGWPRGLWCEELPAELKHLTAAEEKKAKAISLVTASEPELQRPPPKHLLSPSNGARLRMGTMHCGPLRRTVPPLFLSQGERGPPLAGGNKKNREQISRCPRLSSRLECRAFRVKATSSHEPKRVKAPVQRLRAASDPKKSTAARLTKKNLPATDI